MTRKSGRARKTDTLITEPRLTEFERGLADQQIEATKMRNKAALAKIVEEQGDPLSEGLEAIVAGAAPDDAARLRALLGLSKPPGHPRKTSDELADDWRDGNYP
jgi:polyphosphate kinase